MLKDLADEFSCCLAYNISDTDGVYSRPGSGELNAPSIPGCCRVKGENR